MKYFVLLFLVLNSNVYSQDTTIMFRNEMTLDQAKEEARKLNKYIFIDCVASWCVPCKQMQLYVFNKKRVYSFFNEKYLSVRVSFDTVKNEDIGRYSMDEINGLRKRYDVNQLPTYLFLNPSGELVHKDIGFKLPDVFMEMASMALDTARQYYPQISQYRTGYRNYNKLPDLAKLARRIRDTTLADSMAVDYMNNYLFPRKNELFTQKNIGFVFDFRDVIDSRMGIFKLVVKAQRKIDSVMMYNLYSHMIIDQVVQKEDVSPAVAISHKSSIKWKEIEKRIKKKYGAEIAIRNVCDAMIAKYTSERNWERVIEANIRKIDKLGLDTSGDNWAYANNMIYEVFFKHATERSQLKRALRWIKVISAGHPNVPSVLDTYANLLYKLGRVSEAIYWQGNAVVLEKQKALTERRRPDDDILEALTKMKSGKKTWLTEQ